MKIPFGDLDWQWRQISGAVMPELEGLLSRAEYCLGPAVAAFEKAFAEAYGYRHVIGVNSGTSALHLALIAAGVGPGDGVLLPAMTFVATAWAPLYLGARPVLCDVDAVTGEIDLADAERRLDPAVRAILPVHLYGQPVDMDRLRSFAATHRLAIVEDAAQAVGARFAGQAVGTGSQAAAFSFYPGKNLGAAGEAGAVVLDDDAQAARLRALRDHAQAQRYHHTELGFNYRMDGIQGLVLRHKLAHLANWTRCRRDLAARYQAALADLPLVLPQVRNGDHVWHLYVLRTPERDALKQHLTEQGIATGQHYPVPLHRQPALAAYAADGKFPQAERWAEHGLTLPLFASMSTEQQDQVISAIRGFYRNQPI